MPARNPRARRMDFACRLTPELRSARIDLVSRQVAVWDREIMQLRGRLTRALDDRDDFDSAYTASNVCLLISAAAGIVASAGVVAEAYFGAASLQIGASGVQFVPQAVSGLSSGQALITNGVRIGGFSIQRMVLSGRGIRAFLGSRVSILLADLYHFITGFATPVENEAHFREFAERHERREPIGPYLSAAARAFLRDPEAPLPDLHSSRGLSPSPIDQAAIHQALVRLATFHDQMTQRIGIDHESIIQYFTDFATHRSGEQAALDVSTLRMQIALMEMKRRYWEDLLRILQNDETACRNTCE
jgi:hypothetical protein